VDTVTVHEVGSDLRPLLPSRLAQPVMEWGGTTDDFVPYTITSERAAVYAAGNYDFQFLSWTGLASEHGMMCNNGTWQAMTPWLGDMRRNPNPARVVYVRNPKMDDRVTGLVGDHAYWLSDIQTRNETPDFRGTIDVRSDGFGVGEPKWIASKRGLDSVPSNGDFAGNPQARLKLRVNPFVREWRDRPDPPATAPADALHIVAKNIGRVTIDPNRARVDCNATLAVHTDGPLTITLLGCPTRRFG
jgi:hypothetical protein